MRTRVELEKAGILLKGPIVTDWFKKQSDGCSIPGGRLGKYLLKAEQARPACFIHDFMYYLTALQYKHKTPAWVGSRMEADYQLKKNRRLISRHGLMGRVYAFIYFRGVRGGGYCSMKNPKYLAVPPSLEARKELRRYLEIPITKLADTKFKEWEEADE